MEGRVAGLESSMREVKESQSSMLHRVEGLSSQLQEVLLELREQRNLRETENEQLSGNSRKSLLNSSTSNEFKLAARKVELPMFEGVDPVGWLSRAETYFMVQETKLEVRLHLARISMSGGTIHWFNQLVALVPDLDWEKFKQALIMRYSGRNSGSSIDRSSIHGLFHGGLREDIRRAIRLHKPTDRIRLLELARDVEDALLGGGYPSSTGYRSKSRSEGLSGMKGNSYQVERNLFSSEEGRGIVGMKDSRQLQQPEHKVGSGGDVVDKDRRYNSIRSRGTRSLTHSEYEERRKKGLCFKCGHPFGPLHKCPEGNLRILILGDDELKDFERKEESPPEELSAELDIILGISWLKSLGDVLHNWEELVMTFEVNGNRVTLKGQGCLEETPLTCSNCWKRSDSSGPTWMEIGKVSAEVALDPSYKAIIDALMQDPVSRPEFHSTPTGGHSGYLRMYKRIAATLFWRGMKNTIIDFVKSSVEQVAKDLGARDEALRQLKYNLHRAQNLMQKYANAHRKSVEFQVGDWVYLKHRPHRQHSIHSKINSKLAAKCFGPFQILSKHSVVSYKLKLPTESRIFPIFHVSQLKKAIGHHDVTPTLPTDMVVDDFIPLVPAAVLASRTVTCGGISVKQWLVQWRNQSADEATWEDASLIQDQFPEFSLEDKALVEGGIMIGT
ncbi:Chromo-like domain superfamily [Sesbania bispinosa]|nr:Chromo-like domain superfamily [Sesbania bispinosa]